MCIRTTAKLFSFRFFVEICVTQYHIVQVQNRLRNDDGGGDNNNNNDL